jgi:hypothetical protein
VARALAWGTLRYAAEQRKTKARADLVNDPGHIDGDSMSKLLKMENRRCDLLAEKLAMTNHWPTVSHKALRFDFWESLSGIRRRYYQPLCGGIRWTQNCIDALATACGTARGNCECSLSARIDFATARGADRCARFGK